MGKSCYGLPVRQFETAREIALCAQTIPGDEPAVACDARKDDRFRSNTFVTGEPHIRFYVGVPLTSAEGFRLGSLCVFGPEPRPSPDPGKMEALQQIASEVMEQLEASKARNQTEPAKSSFASTRAGA